MISFLIDAAVVGIIAFCGWRGYKNGLIRGVFGVVSLMVALMVANVAAEAYSKEATAVIMPFASGIIDSTLTEMEDNDIRYQAIAHDHDIDDQAFGTAYIVFRQLGLPEAAAVTLAKQVFEDPGSAVSSYAFINSLAEKLTDTLSYVAVFGIAFLILSISFAVLGNLIGFVFSLPGLKLVDVISGSVFGVVKGIVLVLTLALIVRYFGILFLPTLEETTLLNYLVNNNTIANRFGL